ncbi:MAG: GNAT family N-acetyltransferase [Hyphomicrobiaceae bacterium]
MLGARANLQVRLGRANDADRLSEVFAETWRHAYCGIIPHVHLQLMIRRRRPQWWRTAVRSRDSVIVLDFERVVVGYATCGPSRTGGNYSGEIYEIYLLPDYQGVGFGEHLFEACRIRLDDRRLRGLIVWALSENINAAAFYMGRGGRPMTTTFERLGGKRVEKTAYVWDD